MAGIAQPNLYPDQFSGGEGSRLYRSPLMRGRAPTTGSGIAQGIDNLAQALIGPNPAQMALADDRQAQAELRRAQLAKATADLTASQQQRTEAQDPIGSNAKALYGPTIGPLVDAFVKNGGVAPSSPETADRPGLAGGYPMERPTGFTPEREREFRGLSVSGRLPGKTTYEQLQKGLLEQQQGDYRGAIAGDPKPGIDPAKVAEGFYATSGKAPFTEGKQGEAFSPLTGKADASGVIPQANLAEIGAKTSRERAQAGQAGAAAEASRAHAGLYREQTKNVGGEGGGGKGFDTYQDQATGQRWLYNKSTGQAATLNEDGTRTPVPATNIPHTATKIGAVGAGGARENVYIGRVGLAAAEAARDLENISKLPLSSSTGLFGGRTQGPGLLDATKNVLANTVTGQEAQSYNVKATGLMRNLAAIEAAGLMPTGNLTHQMDAVMWKEGDTQITKLQKLAQTRQIVEAGLDHVMANPRVSDSEKSKLQEHVARMQRAVPFSHEDLDGWTAALEQNPNITFKQFLSTKPGAATQPNAEKTATGPRGEKIVLRNGQWVPLK